MMVWSVSNKTSLVLFANKEDADKYVAKFSASVGGGMEITQMPVFGERSAYVLEQEPVAWRYKPSKLAKTWAYSTHVQADTHTPIAAEGEVIEPLYRRSTCEYETGSGEAP